MGQKTKKPRTETSTRRKRSQAKLADRFDCYQKSVQSPEHEIEFFEQVYREVYHRKPYVLREDFCGTFAICCEWVKSNKKRTATGIDLCSDTLQWGRDHNLALLKPSQQERVTLLEQDVRSRGEKADVLAAQNFSFWIFKTRQELVDYFAIARANLKDEGVMVMDMMGGGECYDEGHVEKRKIGQGKSRFEYQWEQVSYNPVNADASFAISFKFKDGSKIKRAFEYDWRFWTIREIRELLAEAGFSESHVYWELEDEDGEDSGVWERSEEADSHPSWIAYIVGVK